MIRFHNLTIQAFRGVPDAISLNLSAPLTLIYAPNGSGKTTICEAAEWLLTGRILRLETSDIDEASGIRCKFSDKKVPTSVSATLQVSDKTIKLERNLTGCRWQVNDQASKRVSQADLLEALAPSALEEGVHRSHANPSRQTWLRGTRFLSGDALSALLDSDKESLSGRQRIFSDLLGVGHLLETERQLDGYIDELDQFIRRQQAILDEKDAQIVDRQTRLEGVTGQTRDDRLAAAAECLRVAYAQMDLFQPGLAEPTEATALSAISTLRATLAARRHGWNQRRQAELRLAADWPLRDSLSEAITADQNRLATLTDDTNKNNTDLAAANLATQRLAADLARAKNKEQDLGNRARGLLGANLGIQVPLQRYLERLEKQKLDLKGARRIVDAAGTDQNRSHQLQKLNSVLVTYSRAQVVQVELEHRKTEHEVALKAAPTADALEVTRRSLQDATERVASIQHSYASAAGPLQQLRHSTLSVVEALGKSEETCPVCFHDWGSPKALREALNSAASAMPKSLAEMDRSLLEAEAKRNQLQTRMLQESQLLSRAIEAERSWRQSEAELAAFYVQVREAGLDSNSPNLMIEATNTAARLELVPPLKAFLDALKLAEQNSSHSIPDSTPLIEAYAKMETILTEARERAAESLGEIVNKHKEAVALVRQIQETVRKLAEERILISKRTEENGRRVQNLLSAWQTLAGASAWTDEALSEVSAALRSDFDKYQSIEQVITQTESLLQELAFMNELESLRLERTPIAAELDRLNRYSEAASTTRAAYKDTRTKHTKEQMAKFVRVISPLFSRMQSNLVYDDVTLGDDATPLSWRAVAEGLDMDPKATFSLGQRQDFALSIFLARARGLGGTFMLDEPVAHLDDLNRVALLDVFRAITLEAQKGLGFVLTTANRPLVRHMIEKFARVQSAKPQVGQTSLLSLVQIDGNPRSGLRLVQSAGFEG